MYPKNWDWRILESEETIMRGMKKTRSAVDVDSAFDGPEESVKAEDGDAENGDAEDGDAEDIGVSFLHCNSDIAC